MWRKDERCDAEGLRGGQADALSRFEERETRSVRDEAAGSEEEGDVDDTL